MQAHLALSCPKVPYEVKTQYLLVVQSNQREQATKKRKVQSQTSLNQYYELTTIDSNKQAMCDRALTKFFVCCSISFHLVEHPFFIDMIKSLCNGYNPPCSTTLSNSMMNLELANIIVDQQLILDREENLTLGLFHFFFLLKC